VTSRGAGANHLVTVCRSLCKWPFSEICQLNIVVIKSSEVFEVFFLICPFKNDRFLLNSNKHCESKNKEGTSSTSGKSVKTCKNRKQDDSYLNFGFTSTEVDGEERPQCVLCMKVLSSEYMLPSKVKHHLETTHPSVVSKPRD
jgi:hypothetical protein